eukprot:TRINITY_DN2338_c0_g1_i6.p1 TRINITY_DN2338_c0_g1~~TRINITY_DN2338_c0_g1_i6.p1  ORF type:complete len:463 (-),score=86.87 TRINITY_DN2338_c0_g1_i6:52-1368(-)
MHWCFPVHSVFCGPTSGIALLGLPETSPDAQMLMYSLKLLKFSACEIASSATVFWLPLEPLQKLCREHPYFRAELARSMARLLVLEFIADEPPYALSHSREALSLSTHEGRDHDPDGSYVKVSQAAETLSKLPYMSLVVMVRGGRGRRRIVHGPGVLLHGTVRVSIVDRSGLAGAINLLHEKLTSPALLPAGALIIDAIFPDEEEIPEPRLDVSAGADAAAPPPPMPWPPCRTFRSAPQPRRRRPVGGGPRATAPAASAPTRRRRRRRPPLRPPRARPPPFPPRRSPPRSTTLSMRRRRRPSTPMTCPSRTASSCWWRTARRSSTLPSPASFGGRRAPRWSTPAAALAPTATWTTGGSGGEAGARRQGARGGRGRVRRPHASPTREGGRRLDGSVELRFGRPRGGRWWPCVCTACVCGCCIPERLLQWCVFFVECVPA